MSVRNLQERLAAVAAVGLLVFLGGCGGFFPPLTDSSGSGSGSTNTGDFVYVANASTQSIASFTVATSTAGAGTLTSISGSPYGLSLQPTAMAITPSNSFMYVAETGGIYAFTINSSTGALTTVSSGGALAIMTYPVASLDVSPDGQWLFALSDDGATIQEYQINATTGALTIQAPATYSITSGATVVPKMVRVAPNGAYVFASLGTAGDVVFPFTTSTGVFGSTYQTLPTGSTTTSDNALAVDSGTTFLYIARSGASSGVAVYAIGSNGALSSVSGSPFAAGGGPFAVLLDSTGKYVYAANRTDGTVSGYSIGTGAVLTALAGSPYASGIGVNSLARDNSGKYVLATGGGGSPDLTMYGFSTATAGELVSATTMATGSDPTQPIMVVATH